MGTRHCPDCGKPITSQSAESIVSALLNEEVGTRLQILAPVIRGKKGTYETLFRELNKKGYSKIRVNGKMYDLDDDKIKLEKYKKHNIEVVVDRQVITTKSKSRLTESIETALREADGVVQIMIESGKEKNGDIKWREILFSQHLACTECGLSFDQLQPRMFSFNSPFGACEKCHGLGTDYEFDP